jgi:hypothetical protein
LMIMLVLSFDVVVAHFVREFDNSVVLATSVADIGFANP